MMRLLKERAQLAGYAQHDGLMIGLLWTASYLLSMRGYETQLLVLFGTALGIYSLILIAKYLRRYRDTVCHGRTTFLLSWSYSMSIFFYASLILATGIFIYHTFFDHGFVFNYLQKAYTLPEMQELLKTQGITSKQLLDTYASYRPIDFAMIGCLLSIMGGLVASIPIALFTRKDVSRELEKPHNNF